MTRTLGPYSLEIGIKSYFRKRIGPWTPLPLYLNLAFISSGVMVLIESKIS